MKACGTTKKASPFGRGGNACIDGEGKPVVKESRYSDEQKPLAEGEHRCALCSRAAALPSQALTRQDRVAAPSIRHASLASCWPLPQQLLPVSAAGGGRRRCSQRERLWKQLFCTKRGPDSCPALSEVSAYSALASGAAAGAAAGAAGFAAGAAGFTTGFGGYGSSFRGKRMIFFGHFWAHMPQPLHLS